MVDFFNGLLRGDTYTEAIGHIVMWSKARVAYGGIAAPRGLPLAHTSKYKAEGALIMYMVIGINGKNYVVDERYVLADLNEWDENFASGMASLLHISEGLSDKHWEVIRFIRDSFFDGGTCPLVYET